MYKSQRPRKKKPCTPATPISPPDPALDAADAEINRRAAAALATVAALEAESKERRTRLPKEPHRSALDGVLTAARQWRRQIDLYEPGRGFDTSLLAVNEITLGQLIIHLSECGYGKELLNDPFWSPRDTPPLVHDALLTLTLLWKRCCFSMTEAANTQEPSQDLPGALDRAIGKIEFHLEHRHAPHMKPHWDGVKLWYRDKVVRSYQRRTAPEQAAVLAALEEAGWPDHHVELPKLCQAKMHITLLHFNEKIKDRIIQLKAAGDSKSVIWEKT